jgi:glycosyltransferase involved in cell wall biosynthesis
MRVTHISIIHTPLDTRIFNKQCRALAAAGYDVHLVVGGAPTGQLDGVYFHSIAETAVRPPASRQFSRLVRATCWALRLRPSLYHLHDPHLIPLGLLLKLAGARVVYDVHEDYPAHARTKLADHPLRGMLKALMWRVLEWFAQHALDGFVCASPALAGRFPPARTVEVGNLPLHREFAAAAANGPSRPYRERSNTVVYIGSISKVRGFSEMGRALELLPAELDCRLRLVGSFRSVELARRAAQLEARHRLDVIPFQPYPVVIRELLSARVGLVVLHPLPNHVDAIRSNKLFEYMAAGIPLIAADLPRWREIVRGVDCGLVVEPRDPAAIARAIEYLLTHPEEAEAMGQRGREAVSTQFNWDREGARLLSFYRELIGGGSDSSS